MNINDNIKYLRIKSNMSINDLADKMHVSSNTISNWESGEEHPNKHQVIRLSRIFHVTTDSLNSTNIGDNRKHIITKSNNKIILDKKNQTSISLISLSPILIAVIIYLCIGFILSMWHPTWLIFVYALGIMIMLLVILDKRSGNTLLLRILKGLIESLYIFGLAIFLNIAFSLNVWHPTWLIFVVTFVLCLVLNAIISIVKKRTIK